MSDRIECEPGCSCRGTNGLLQPNTPCYDEAVIRALDLITVVSDQVEAAASKLRHPSQARRLPDWMKGQL